MRVLRLDLIACVAVVQPVDGDAFAVPLKLEDSDHSLIADFVAGNVDPELAKPDAKRTARVAELRAAHEATCIRHYGHDQGRALEQLAIQAELLPLEEQERHAACVAALKKGA